MHDYAESIWGQPGKDTGLPISLSTARFPYGATMGFEITLSDRSTEHVHGADGYAFEGPLTTFFQSSPGRAPRLDPWSVRILSIRTDQVLRIRAVDNDLRMPIGLAG